ncbi:MAG: hypothetical protein K9K67_06900 [Bacteriovoracaceae bacterium]|nr:hypothetical protein [Bacteriovoracaceae bacterium]
MIKSQKNLRQIFLLVWSISQSKASQEEVRWARRELEAYLLKVLSLGLYP